MTMDKEEVNDEGENKLKTIAEKQNKKHNIKDKCS